MNATSQQISRCIPSVNQEFEIMCSNAREQEVLQRIHTFWRDANHLSVGRIYLADMHGFGHFLRAILRLTIEHWNFRMLGPEEALPTPFDMTVLIDLDRFHLAMDAIDRLSQTSGRGSELKQQLMGTLIEHKKYIQAHGEDMPAIRDWVWNEQT